MALGVLLALLAVDTAAPRSQPPASTITLEWDRNRDTAVGYVVHVGTEPRVYDETFDVGDSTTFTYDNGVAGTRYYFAVSAYDIDGRESPLSNEVSGVIGGGARRTTAAPASPPAPAAPVPEIAGTTIGSVAALPDGRLLYVENGQHVRLVSSGGSPAVAVSIAGDDRAAITEVIVDPAFERTNFVFVGMTLPQSEGRKFQIVRYRLVLDTLGEGAVVVSALPFQGDDIPRFAVDGAGRIYVAMPGASRAGADPYAGRLLRFARDGSVPPDHRAASPVIATSPPVPLDVDWDGVDLWVLGRDEHGESVLARLPSSDAGEWPLPLHAFSPPDMPVASLAAIDVRALRHEGRVARLAVVADPSRRFYLWRMPDATSNGAIEPLAWTGDAQPIDAVMGSDGAVHALAYTPAGSLTVSSIRR